jgi:hypothetical protein
LILFFVAMLLSCVSPILPARQESFQIAVRALERYVHRFQRRLKKKLQAAIDANREVGVTAQRCKKSSGSMETASW